MPLTSSLKPYGLMTEKVTQFLTGFLLNRRDICFSCSEHSHKVLAEHSCWASVGVAVIRLQHRGHLGCMCPTMLSCVGLAAAQSP